MEDKYKYNNANKVISDKYGNLWPCFAQHYGCKWFGLPLVMSEEYATKYLEEIKTEIPFEYEFYKRDKKPFVKITAPRSNRSFLILFGNLCKGVSEFAWYCERHVEIKEDLPFLVKNWVALGIQEEKKEIETMGHFWFIPNLEKYHTLENYKHKTKTLKQLFDNLEKFEDADKSYCIWETCLK